MDLDKANAHIELLTKLAGENKELPQIEQKNQDRVQVPVTINNNYNSNVIAVISKDGEKQQEQTNIPPSAINIFMGQKGEDDKKELQAQSQNQPNKNEEITHEYTDKSKKLNELTAGLLEGDKEKIMDRLLQSVNMVKEVLQSNLKLREHIQELNQKVDQQNADIFHLQGENEEQKDKIQILAGIQHQLETPTTKIKNTEITAAYKATDNIARKHNISNRVNTSVNRMNVADEILQLKRDKNMLEQRVQYLEQENIYMRTGTSHENRPIVSGTDDYEPVRSVLNGAGIVPTAPMTRKVCNSTNRKRIRRNVKGSKIQEIPRTSISKARNTCKPASI